MEGLVLYNTRTRRKERFEPLEKGHARVYSCGPTVYSPQHLGNLRPYLVADLLKRALLAEGLRVTHVDQHHRRRAPHRRRGCRRRQDGAGRAADRPARGGDRRRVHGAVAARPPAGQLPRRRGALQGHRAHPRADRAGPDPRGEGLHATGIADGIYFDISKFPRYAEFARLDLEAQVGGKPNRGGGGQAPPGGLRPLEVRRARGSSGSRSGTRPGAAASPAGTSSARP